MPHDHGHAAEGHENPDGQLVTGQVSVGAVVGYFLGICITVILSFILDPIRWIGRLELNPEPTWGDPHLPETRAYKLSSFFALVVAGVGCVIGGLKLADDSPGFGLQPALVDGASIGLAVGGAIGVLTGGLLGGGSMAVLTRTRQSEEVRDDQHAAPDGEAAEGCRTEEGAEVEVNRRDLPLWLAGDDGGNLWRAKS